MLNNYHMKEMIAYENDNGYLSVHDILLFPRMKQLKATKEDIISVRNYAKNFELSADNKKIRKMLVISEEIKLLGLNQGGIRELTKEKF